MTTSSPSLLSRLVGIGVPLIILGGLIAWLIISPPQLRLFSTAATEQLDIEQVILQPGRFELVVRNTGAESLSIAQVTINDAAWISLVLPKTTIDPLTRATIQLDDYEWIEGQTYQIIIYTTTANTFVVDIPDARVTPQLTQPNLLTLLLSGFLIGMLPLYVGLSWWPMLRQLYLPSWLIWVGVAIGLIFGRGVDLLPLVPHFVRHIGALYQAWGLVIIGLVFALGMLYRRASQGGDDTSQDRFLQAYRVVIALGLLGFGEGLILGQVMGSQVSAAPLWLQSPLWIVGLLILNASKGLILALILSDLRPMWVQWILFGFIAGFPLMLGIVLGAFPMAMPLLILLTGAAIGAFIWVNVELLWLARTESDNAPYWGQIAVGVTIGLILTWLVNLAVTIV
ncbi:MAG: hypothetical protein AAF629_24035 [Chloroflexota bacterium]